MQEMRTRLARSHDDAAASRREAGQQAQTAKQLGQENRRLLADLQALQGIVQAKEEQERRAAVSSVNVARIAELERGAEDLQRRLQQEAKLNEKLVCELGKRDEQNRALTVRVLFCLTLVCLCAQCVSIWGRTDESRLCYGGEREPTDPICLSQYSRMLGTS